MVARISILLLISTIKLALSSLVCDSYKCDKSIAALNYCYLSKFGQNNTSDISVYSCQESFTSCDVTPRTSGNTNDISVRCKSRILESTEGFVIDLPAKSLVDGERCYRAQDCYGGLKCEMRNGDAFTRCYSSSGQGSTCSSSMDCKKLFYCDASLKTCQSQKEIGKTCSVDEECINKAGCFNKTCTEYFTLKPGTLAKQSESIYCNSTFVYNGMCQDYMLLDSDGQKAFTVDCTKTEKCTYFLPLKNDIITLNSTDGYCNCGYNTERKAYCKHGSDTIAAYEAKVLEKRLLAVSPCHVSKKLTCNEITDKDRLNLQFLKNSHSGKLQKVENCVSLFISGLSYLTLAYIPIIAIGFLLLL